MCWLRRCQEEQWLPKVAGFINLRTYAEVHTGAHIGEHRRETCVHTGAETPHVHTGVETHAHAGSETPHVHIGAETHAHTGALSDLSCPSVPIPTCSSLNSLLK